MKIAILQPYLFPYLGYFQLMCAVDKTLFLDDAAYIKKGWINRNRILTQGKPAFIVFPIVHASQNKCINALNLVADTSWKLKLEKTIEQCYKKAPQFSAFFPVFRQILHNPEPNLSAYAQYSFELLFEYMQMKINTLPSTKVFQNTQLKAQARIIDFCKREQALGYVNPPGGTDLYDKNRFSEAGLTLQFLQPMLNPYKQINANVFVPGLSIIDVLMHCELPFVNQQLHSYQYA